MFCIFATKIEKKVMTTMTKELAMEKFMLAKKTSKNVLKLLPKSIKTAFVAVCVVAAGMGVWKAYNVPNQSEADMLLAENVEALSSGDDYSGDWCYLFGCYGDDTGCNYYESVQQSKNVSCEMKEE